MLEKPKFLTGEVKEFIDGFDNMGVDKVGSYAYLPQIKLIANFFNQPFDTAMIEKYFKDDCVRFEYGSICMWVLKDSGGNWLFPIPKTLSQFITFALSAGIKLEWSE